MTPLIEPFRLAIPETELHALRTRLLLTRWPDDPGNESWKYGVNATYLRTLTDYWLYEYDWRGVEARINSYPQFRASVQGIPIHYIHVRAESYLNPIPLVIMHGWPWSFWDLHLIIDPLVDPKKYGGDQSDAFDIVIPSLPGYGFSSPLPISGINFWKTADLINQLMTEGLGYAQYGASGGDWGALISSQLGHKYAATVIGVHLLHAMLLDQFEGPRSWDVTARSWDQRAPVPSSLLKYVSHFAVHTLDPQTLAYALSDSPVGLLAWMLERWRAWGDTKGDVENVFSREHMITTAMIYWLTNTAGSSMRAYADAVFHPWQPSHFRTPVVEAPVGLTLLGGENPPGIKTEERAAAFLAGPRARYFNVHFVNAHEVGGHFGYFENPAAVIHDIRETFRPMR